MTVIIKKRGSHTCEIHQLVTVMDFLTAEELGLKNNGFVGAPTTPFVAIVTNGICQYYSLETYMVKVVKNNV